jgi:hypothetical protein
MPECKHPEAKAHSETLHIQKQGNILNLRTYIKNNIFPPAVK